MPSTLQIRHAQRGQNRGRVAIIGPAGSGKTFTGLTWARVLAGTDQIAVIDTEHGSSELYADIFNFEMIDLQPPYHPDRLREALDVCADAGMGVVMVDSGSHFWSGKGGVLELVDAAKARFGGNSHMAWAEGTPIQQRMVEALLGYPGHVIFTMRAKTEWGTTQEEGRRPQPVRIGMAPQQRDGLEYEFTLMGELEVPSNRMHISKSRADGWIGRYFDPEEAADAAQEFLQWLSVGDPIVTPDEALALTQLIGSVVPDDKAQLAIEWRNAGLPKVANMTLSQADVGRQVIAKFRIATEEDTFGIGEGDVRTPAGHQPAASEGAPSTPRSDPPPAGRRSRTRSGPAAQAAPDSTQGDARELVPAGPAIPDGQYLDDETGELRWLPGHEPFES